MAIVHELSWSTSRARTFESCPRKYYFDYYLSWLGWGRSADPERRRAYLLKKMTRMPMFAGDIVHRAIEEFFARRDQGLPWTADESVKWAVTELRRGYKESRDGGWKARPAKSVRLAEHHYGESRVNESTDDAARYGKRYVERIEGSLRSFFDDPALDPMRTAQPSDWLACEEMSTFELFDTRVFAIPDFAYLDAAGEAEGARSATIVDWKTGRPREADRFQLEVYAFYARERWGLDPERTRALDVYLATGEVHEVRVTQDVLEGALARIEASIGAMRAVHFNADESKGDPDAFPMIPEEDSEAVRSQCGTCNYRELCGRAGA